MFSDICFYLPKRTKYKAFLQRFPEGFLTGFVFSNFNLFHKRFEIFDSVFLDITDAAPFLLQWLIGSARR